MSSKLPPVHPGEILREDFLAALGLSEYRLARGIGVDPRRINLIVKGRRSITGDTALRLARFFGTTAQFWMNLQSRYDLDRASDEHGTRIEAEVDAFAAGR